MFLVRNLGVAKQQRVSGSAICRGFARLNAPHENFITNEFIEAASARLLRDKKTRVTDVNQFLTLFRSEMNSSNYINFLERCGRRKILQPNHVFAIGNGLLYCKDENPVSLNEIDKLFQSLGYMSAKHRSTRALLVATSFKLKNSDNALTGAHIGKYINALRDMRSGHPEVRELLEVLTEKIAGSDDKLTAHDATLALSGLQCLSSEYAEVRSMVRELSSKLSQACEGKLNNEQFITVMLGIRRLRNDHTEVQNLLQALMMRVDTEAQDVVNAHQCREALSVAENVVVHKSDGTEELLAHLNRILSTLTSE
mmetsp:Transcript_2719/g.4081  ORF Transcript_2719/g.4081 Transcript_2719/m.4081 type:complete len:311 (+) Transcript_2719:84-1016(+)|eukprot:CAMPEP_0185026918 /NCGR_PEP_ID=MMETSP1103-20130426/11560_1 /TAXON_ID=36769 /ORGANISM="Paraphysomonas bandaiensis, Strain Caron Lab Isolate" /LENGTH=310 /DNA_ID=CAMNT_0027560679 /DNA_START=17 /DNA_END=949 /DNA_ORIENTATION=-